MHKINPDKLFSIFESNDSEEYEKNEVKHLLDNPYIILGMVTKNMENYEVLAVRYSMQFGEAYEKVADKIKTAYFNRLYEFVERVTDRHLDEIHPCGDYYDISRLISALTKLLQYYEEREMYMRCATIKKLIDNLI